MSYQIWITNEGIQIPIARMTDAHLKNSIAMIERERWQSRFPQYQRLLREREARAFAHRLKKGRVK